MIKNIIYTLAAIMLVFVLGSCEKDNYSDPDATIQGQIVDHNGNPLQTEQGNGNMRIKMEELSWAKGNPETVITPTYLNMKQDGSYIHTKIFSGEYRMTPIEGAFYPYKEEGEIVQIRGSVTQNFTVIPYLDVEWVDKPTLTADNKITCSIRFKRNAKEGVAMPDLNNAKLFIASTQYVGNNNKDDQINGGTVTVTNEQEGTVISFTSNTVRFTSMTYWVRVGVCCNDSHKKYNYTDIQKVKID
ncbi:MAG: DUF3823 domain-containing protein [Bacteroides sp.]|nr:DUF3823 domain-containing protein [Bacteroides sp.]